MSRRTIVLSGAVLAADISFTPLDMPQGNTENRTGMWFRPDLGKAADILPLKLDFTWEKLGTTRDKPRLGLQFVVAVQGPIEERTWLILDRIGTEAPDFDPKPKIEPQTGPKALLEGNPPSPSVQWIDFYRG